jgi:hypothetical protein
MPAEPSTAGCGSALRTRVSSGCAAKQEKPEAKQRSRPPRPRRDMAAPGFPRNRHTRSRVDPDETTKADLVEREGRRPWLLAHGKAELAKAITRAQ